MKKLLLGISVVAAANVVMAATEEVSYLDYDERSGARITKKEVCEIVTSTTDTFENGAWYAVKGDVTRDGEITVSGSAHLVLCDNCNFTVKKGIGVASGNSLVIHGQANDSGLLTATGDGKCAGIGGRNPGWIPEEGNCGSVTIIGGNVTAQGGVNAAGIGGGSGVSASPCGAGGTVTINGGVVKAQGGRYTTGATGGGAGIGGGWKGAGATVTINGGQIEASGSDGLAAIGHGYVSEGHVLDAGTVKFSERGTFWVEANNVEMTQEAYESNHSAASVSIKSFFTLLIPQSKGYTYVVSGNEGEIAATPVTGGQNRYILGWDGEATVYFTLDEGYKWLGSFDNPMLFKAESCEVVIAETQMPVAVPLDAWSIGKDDSEGVTAYVREGVLYVNGNGAMCDFARASDVPWADCANEIASIMIASGVTQVGKNAWTCFSDEVTINRMPLGTIRFVAGSAVGADELVVKKSELQAAKAEAVSIEGGVVTLAVGVNSNGNFTAETKDWNPVELKQENVAVKDGKIVISIPVSDSSGFMILQSGDAKISPAN